MKKSENEFLHEELLKAKAEIVTLLHEFNERVSQVTAALLLRAEQIKPELGEGFKGRIRRIVYKEVPASGEGVMVQDKEKILDEVKPLGKRFCSVCRKSGHRKNSCPER